ncbi:hypothetical protein BCR32DRAFT_288312 [Anaeromyces robustus]|uniref:Uncharacterized protein n=1 Tax=Anaeromyces robustus TaxID=1754192 RepID=A0A1Y1UZS2_9FUNG|nr:hypothetical protein BCR32DRAFT_288312 [Anaeromyces robustus]|eukprot:ORX44294.1 hypothetical protein BCR32DRAFT_288312 [Anaeromyces robustus]
MKSLTFALIILTLILLSCVFGKSLDYNEDEDKLSSISFTTTTTTTITFTTTENDINSSWEKYSLVFNSLITSLFNKGNDIADTDADAEYENENEK